MLPVKGSGVEYHGDSIQIDMPGYVEVDMADHSDLITINGLQNKHVLKKVFNSMDGSSLRPNNCDQKSNSFDPFAELSEENEMVQLTDDCSSPIRDVKDSLVSLPVLMKGGKQKETGKICRPRFRETVNIGCIADTSSEKQNFQPRVSNGVQDPSVEKRHEILFKCQLRNEKVREQIMREKLVTIQLEKEKFILEKEKFAAEKLVALQRVQFMEEQMAAERENLVVGKERLALEWEKLALEKKRLEFEREKFGQNKDHNREEQLAS